MVLSDTLLTIFEARGATAVLNSFVQLGNVQDRLAVAQDKFNRASTPVAIRNAWSELKNAESAYFTSMITHGGIALGITAALAVGVHKIVTEYVNLGNQIMNIRDLTGSSTADAVHASLLAKAGGLNDPRALLDLNKSVFQTGGQTALARLGIAANPNQSGLELFNRVADALDRYPNGLRKAQIMQQIFGESGTQALLPLLRLTKEQRAQVAGLSNEFSGNGLAAIQQYQFASNMLGLAWQQKIIIPLGSTFLPMMEHVVDSFAAVVNVWNMLDEKMGGGLTTLAAWVVGLLAIGSAVYGIAAVMAAFQKLNAVLAITDTLEAIMDALSGNWAAIAGAVAAVGIVGGAIYLANQNGGAGSGASKPINQFSDSVDKFGAYVNRMGDSFDSVKGNAIPSGMKSQDLPALAHQMANGFIG